MNKRVVYKAARIFIRHSMLSSHAIIVNDGLIEDIVPAASLGSDVNVVDEGDVILAPAFIDLQLYGAYQRLLAVYPDAETVAAIYDYSVKGGAAFCMPTVATNTYEVIFNCIDAVKDYWKRRGRGVLGLHVEGPWISKAKRGAHVDEFIFSPTVLQVKELLNYGKDVIKMITLAPEECSDEIIDLIQSYGIIVSAGHSNASYEQAIHAFDKIGLATHIYNAMSALQHREPGMVGALFNHLSVRSSLVPDGYHVDFAAIKIAKKMMGNRLFAITDAVTETTKGYYKHYREGDKYTAGGILSGSALTMHKAFTNLVFKCDIPVEEALRMCSLYPAQAAKIEGSAGILQKGYKANIVVLDKELQLVKTIIH
ncbi:MAG: N-acetylglucosamine-6-phosphate deacetylase [Ferruginibacter sp.]